eukprot:CAMPEP_0184326272 /NCGR_PEP_ID=MMETSP1049-20130417/142474_1 /TAXON_ID=77928 /ORGANISM="Proteomonas sulcata, Strain CCMP704" /LENGTH=77 /DNA_ID=CAMNT_0026648457 /DNA_START=50 /DNA_END=283 /DNA_ORIENTATION=-
MSTTYRGIDHGHQLQEARAMWTGRSKEMVEGRSKNRIQLLMPGDMTPVTCQSQNQIRLGMVHRKIKVVNSHNVVILV